MKQKKKRTIKTTLKIDTLLLNPLITSQTKQRDRKVEGDKDKRTERIRTQALSYSSRVTSKARGCHGDSAGLGKDVLTWESVEWGGGANIQTHRQERVGGLK